MRRTSSALTPRRWRLKASATADLTMSMVTLEMIEQLTYRYADEFKTSGNEARIATKPERVWP